MASFNDSESLNRRGFLTGVGGSLASNDSDTRLKDPLLFPENISSVSAFNNHFMIINILEAQKAALPGTGRTTEEKTVQSIVLYMPNTLNFTQNNQYEDVSLTSIAGKAVLGVVGAFSKTLREITEAIGAAGETVGKLGGFPLNPQTEVLFSNVALRTFQFDFLFAPTTERETQTLNRIIKEMRLAAAPGTTGPSIGTGSSAPTLLFEPPQKLNIHFYQKRNGETVENPYLPKLRTCVIESLDFDFAPSGIYSTFSNGYPVSTRMMLRVKEDEVLIKDYINEGY